MKEFFCAIAVILCTIPLLLLLICLFAFGAPTLMHFVHQYTAWLDGKGCSP